VSEAAAGTVAAADRRRRGGEGSGGRAHLWRPRIRRPAGAVGRDAPGVAGRVCAGAAAATVSTGWFQLAGGPGDWRWDGGGGRWRAAAVRRRHLAVACRRGPRPAAVRRKAAAAERRRIGSAAPRRHYPRAEARRRARRETRRRRRSQRHRRAARPPSRPMDPQRPTSRERGRVGGAPLVSRGVGAWRVRLRRRGAAQRRQLRRAPPWPPNSANAAAALRPAAPMRPRQGAGAVDSRLAGWKRCGWWAGQAAAQRRRAWRWKSPAAQPPLNPGMRRPRRRKRREGGVASPSSRGAGEAHGVKEGANVDDRHSPPSNGTSSLHHGTNLQLLLQLRFIHRVHMSSNWQMPDSHDSFMRAVHCASSVRHPVRAAMGAGATWSIHGGWRPHQARFFDAPAAVVAEDRSVRRPVGAVGGGWFGSAAVSATGSGVWRGWAPLSWPPAGAVGGGVGLARRRLAPDGAPPRADMRLLWRTQRLPSRGVVCRCLMFQLPLWWGPCGQWRLSCPSLLP